MMWSNVGRTSNVHPVDSRHQGRQIQSQVINAPHLPTMVDLQRWMAPADHQKDMNTCVATAFASACEFAINKSTGHHTNISRLFINYNGRLAQPTFLAAQDLGSSVKHTALALRRYGICEEAIWKYYRKNLRRTPPPEVYAKASQFAVTVLKLEPTLVTMKTCLAKQIPFIVSIALLKSAKEEADANHGYVSMPDLTDSRMRKSITSHAVLVVGYNDRTQHFLVRNSWGPDWGLNGYFLIPYQYLLDPQYFDATDGIWAVENVSLQQGYLPPIHKIIVRKSHDSHPHHRHHSYFNSNYSQMTSLSRDVRHRTSRFKGL